MYPDMNTATMPKSAVSLEEFANEIAEKIGQFGLQDQNAIINIVIDMHRKRRIGMIEELEQRTKELHISVQQLPNQSPSNAQMR